MYPGGYTAEVTNLSPKATEKDVYGFFAHCGAIEHVEIIRSGEYTCTAYVTFKDAYALETAILLSGATIVDQCVFISQWGSYIDESDPWNGSSWKHQQNSSTATHMSQYVSTPGEAVTVAQEVVKTMLAKGYILGNDAIIKAKAFDEKYHVVEITKSAATATGITAVAAATVTGRTAVAAANAVVNSSYFAKGALWVSDVLTRAAKVAADMGSHDSKKEKS
ncbi:hypothetical protein L1049_003356 [Liquidambar formosana]|uniref:RRM domain-containing protein n=1 Tax=Liquidambar formosana TaxID=63359 RepID=A0AAP0NJ95_LIQFO